MLSVVGMLCVGLAQVAASSPAQSVIQVEVRAAGTAVAGALVTAGEVKETTSSEGLASLRVAPGPSTVVVTKEGYAVATAAVTVAAGQTQKVVIELQAELRHAEEVTVSATRTDRRLEDQPMRVEVLGREEVEEKMLMTPGDIVMMLNEMGGMRVQATSPSLGAASVRVQGMRGRYTRYFSDGLPLFGEVGGLGLLQIPPMDLGRVEVIKGVASSLYGVGAMGGVVNLVSRRPAEARETEMLFNQSSRGATDVVGWHATPARQGWAMTLLGGGHFQQQADVDDDGWSDLSGYSRAVVRPRVFWDGGAGRTLFATAGFTAEDREGGGRVPDGEYREALMTQRMDGGVAGQALLQGKYLLNYRAALMHQDHDHQFGETLERDSHGTAFGEVTLRAMKGRHTIVGGVAIEHDRFRPVDLPQFAYTHTTPGAFIQDDLDVTRWLTVSASGRFDYHSEYGAFFSPRVSGLLRSGGWVARLSFGMGFYGPSPLTEETEAAGLSRLVIPAPLEAERGRSATFDISRTDGPVSWTVTLFRSHVSDPIHVDRSGGLVLTNLTEPVTTAGLELLGTLRREEIAVTGSYAYVRARETVTGLEQDVPLTPRHSAGMVGMWEREDTGRIGVELYFTGSQRLEENPYRDVSPAYVIFGVLAEWQVGKVRLFVNGENLGGTRQTRWDPLVRPSRAPDGRWTVDAWALLDGRTINGGVRVKF
jgi:iron complex outermembrane receptor protein